MLLPFHVLNVVVQLFDVGFFLFQLWLVLRLFLWQFCLVQHVHVGFFLVRSFDVGFFVFLLVGELHVVVLPFFWQFCQLLPFHEQFILVQLIV